MTTLSFSCFRAVVLCVLLLLSHSCSFQSCSLGSCSSSSQDSCSAPSCSLFLPSRFTPSHPPCSVPPLSAPSILPSTAPLLEQHHVQAFKHITKHPSLLECSNFPRAGQTPVLSLQSHCNHVFFFLPLLLFSCSFFLLLLLLFCHGHRHAHFSWFVAYCFLSSICCLQLRLLLRASILPQPQFYFPPTGSACHGLHSIPGFLSFHLLL